MRPFTPLMIVAAPNVQAIEDELRNYGWSIVFPIPDIVMATTLEETEDACMRAPAMTPWCTIANTPSVITDTLRTYMPFERNFAQAFRMLNDEYAINPKRFVVPI